MPKTITMILRCLDLAYDLDFLGVSKEIVFRPVLLQVDINLP